MEIYDLACPMRYRYVLKNRKKIERTVQEYFGSYSYFLLTITILLQTFDSSNRKTLDINKGKSVFEYISIQK